MDRIEDLFIGRLINHGVERDAIPGFLKNLSTFLAADPDMSLSQVNQRLNYLGWLDIQLDYQTLQLAIAFLESALSRPLGIPRGIDPGPPGRSPEPSRKWVPASR
jgi:hypothetical protein